MTRAEIGCVIGTGIGGLTRSRPRSRCCATAVTRPCPPLSVPLMMGNAGAAALAMRHGLHGQTYGVVSACAAGSPRDRLRGANDRMPATPTPS